MLNYYLRCLPYILQHNAVVSFDVVEWCCTCVLWVICVSCSLCLESILLQWLKASRTLISGSEGNYITLQRGNNKIWIFISTERDRRSVKLIGWLLWVLVIRQLLLKSFLLRHVKSDLTKLGMNDMRARRFWICA